MQELIVRSKQDISEFVSTQPTSRSAWLIVLVALGGIFVDAYDFTSIGIGVVQLRTEFGLSPFAVGSVTAIMAIGAFFGALCGGYYTDKFGRYKMFLLDLIFLVVAAIGAALSVNLWMLLFFRFLMGVGVGLDFPVALSYVAEFVNARKKSSSVTMWQGMWYVAASCTGLIVLPFYFADYGSSLWRIAVGFGAVPALIILILRYRLMAESPTWAAYYIGLHEAAAVLEKMYPVKVKVIATKDQAAAAPVHINYFEIFSPKYRAGTILASIISMTQSMEYYAVGFNLPSISNRIFGSGFLYAILGAIVFNLFGIVGGFGGAFTSAVIGARRLAIFGYSLVIISLLSIYLGRSYLSLGATALLIGVFIFGHSFGPGGQGMTIATLAFPTRIRGVGTGFVHAMLRVGSVLGFYFFPLVVAKVGLTRMMLFLVIVPIAGLIATLSIQWKPVAQDIDAEDNVVATVNTSVDKV